MAGRPRPGSGQATPSASCAGAVGRPVSRSCSRDGMASLPLFRYAFQERLRAVFAPPARVLEVGKQAGEDALVLRGTGGGVEVRAPEDLGGLAPAFDGDYCSLGALEGADLGRAGRDLAAALRPGAPVLLGLANPRSAG